MYALSDFQVPRRWMLSLFAIAVSASLVLSHWAAYNKPSANFFLLPTKAWEIGMGAIIALLLLKWKHKAAACSSNKLASEASGLLGLFLIGFSVFAFDESTPFPSLYALAPAIGAGLVVFFSSPETIVGRLLGTRALVGTGLISYGAYLWHQPLFSFARHRSLTEPSKPLFLILTALSFLFAFLSWKYVERPSRRKDLLGRRTIFSLAIAGSAVFISIGMAGSMTDGFSGRSAKSDLTLRSIQEKLKINHGLSGDCDGSFTLCPDCRTSDEPEVVVWGDSFAMHLVQGIMASKPDAKIVQMTKSNCGPFFDIAPVVRGYSSEDCLVYNGKVRKWLQENDTVKYAVLSSNFGIYISDGREIALRDGSVIKSNLEFAVKEMRKTIGELKTMGIVPTLFSPAPSNGTDHGRCIVRAEYSGLDLGLCDFPVEEMRHDRTSLFDFLGLIGNNNRIVHLEEFICDSSICHTHLDSVPLFRDANHLSIEGAAALGRKFDFYGILVKGN